MRLSTNREFSFLHAAVLLVVWNNPCICVGGFIRHDRQIAAYKQLGRQEAFQCVGEVAVVEEPGEPAEGKKAGAVLIAPQWALTAGHVATKTDLEKQRYKFGDEQYRALRRVLHPGFDPETDGPDAWLTITAAGVDLALIQLDRPVGNVRPASRYRGEGEVGRTMVKIGYGIIGDGKKGPVRPVRQERLGGINVIDAAGGTFDDLAVTERVLLCDFDAPDDPKRNRLGKPNPLELEVGCSGGDSGGGWFIRDGSSWKLVAISQGEVPLKGYSSSLYGSIWAGVRISKANEWMDAVIVRFTPLDSAPQPQLGASEGKSFGEGNQTTEQSSPTRRLSGLVVESDVSHLAISKFLILEGIRARLSEQAKKIESLHLRIRRVTTLSVDPEVVLGGSSGLDLPERLGTDEVLVAFKGDKRYVRVLELEYKPTLPLGSLPKPGKSARRYFDEAKAWTGNVLLERNRDPQSGEFVYRSKPAEKASDCFPPPSYLMNVGLAVPDPTGKDQARRNLQQMGFLPDLFQRRPYKILSKTEKIDHAACVLLEGRFECLLSVGAATKEKQISDRLWLDLEHGLALRKRETRIDGQLVRVVNSDFEQVLPGFWLPRRSRTETFAPPDAPKRYRDRPAVTREFKLCLWVVNRTPDELFDITPLKRVRPSLDTLPAYRIRSVSYRRRGEHPGLDVIRAIEETWMVRGLGCRREVSSGSKTLFLTVETPRWRFAWDPAENLVVASPSRLEQASRLYFRHLRGGSRGDWIRFQEQLTGVFACARDRLDGREVEKITVYLPPDTSRRLGTQYCTHGFDPKGYLQLSGTEFRSRTCWFDPGTGLPLQKHCGCARPNERTADLRVDYPAPESVPGELFTFRVPRDATLEIDDPQLNRRIFSKGQTFPDPRE